MDVEKVEFFVSRFRRFPEDEILSALARVDTLVEEAQVALKKVASERSIILSDELANQIHSEQLAEIPANIAEERSYSAAAVGDIHAKTVSFLWSIPLGLAMAFFLRSYAPNSGIAKLIPSISMALPLYCLYRLSLSIDSSRSVAWTMVGIQAIPVVGWVAAISLVLKARRIKAASDSRPLG